MDQFITFYYGWMMDGSVDLLNFLITALCLLQSEWFIDRSAY